jgi:acyl-CoA hydrolase
MRWRAQDRDNALSLPARFAAEYAAKRVTAEAALAGIQSGSHVAMGMAVAEPPALLTALAARVEAGSLNDLKLWYFHSMAHAAETVLRYDLLDRIRPHCMFLSKVERALTLPRSPDAALSQSANSIRLLQSRKHWCCR